MQRLNYAETEVRLKKKKRESKNTRFYTGSLFL